MAFVGNFLVCPYCGTILTAINGIAPITSGECPQNRCRIKRKTHLKIISGKRQTYRLTYATRRFISEPGQPEINLAEKLRKIGVGVDLWPKLDTYDLAVTFPGQSNAKWVFDVKDWSSPAALALNILMRGKPSIPHLSQEKAFFVFPDAIKIANPGYLNAFRNECGDFLNKQGIKVMFSKDVVAMCEREIKKGKYG